jgi:hypothetical protein
VAAGMWPQRVIHGKFVNKGSSIHLVFPIVLVVVLMFRVR